MEQSDEHLVDKKIAEAKLEVAEKRLQITIWSVGILLTIMAAIFGMIIPMISANRNSDKVDEQIRWMQKEVETMKEKFDTKKTEYEGKFKSEVKEINSRQETSLGNISNNADKIIRETKENVEKLIGAQLTKPKLTCLYKGHEINGKTVSIVRNDFPSFEIDNKGDAQARNVKVVVYTKQNSKINWFDGGHWLRRAISEDKDYSQSYLYRNNIDVIDAGYSTSIEIEVEENAKPVKDELMMKIFYGLPEPTVIRFTLELK